MSIEINLYNSIVHDLETAGAKSPYPADANEPDPRYKSYGVRANGKKDIIALHKTAIRALAQKQQTDLAKKLVHSKYGEQQSVALFIFESFPDYFTPDRFEELDTLIRCIHGWSKVDSFTGSLLRAILFNHPKEMMKLVRTWNKDDDIWLKRFSVVLFTRKVATSGVFTTFALEMCDNLLYDKEPLVLKGVGWALKDLMKADKKRIVDYLIKLRKNGVSSTILLYAIKDLKGQERRNFLSITPNR